MLHGRVFVMVGSTNLIELFDAGDGQMKLEIENLSYKVTKTKNLPRHAHILLNVLFIATSTVNHHLCPMYHPLSFG